MKQLQLEICVVVVAVRTAAPRQLLLGPGFGHFYKCGLQQYDSNKCEITQDGNKILSRKSWSVEIHIEMGPLEEVVQVINPQLNIKCPKAVSSIISILKCKFHLF